MYTFLSNSSNSGSKLSACFLLQTVKNLVKILLDIIFSDSVFVSLKLL